MSPEIHAPSYCPQCRAAIIQRVFGLWCPRCRGWLVQRYLPRYHADGNGIPSVWGIRSET